MPFTPFHFGPGALVKAALPSRFSFRAFALCQVVIDCETAWNIYRGHARLHTLFHSYIGVSLVMGLTGLLLISWNLIARKFPNSWVLRELEDWGEPFRLRSALLATLFGGWTHVFLDSIMHADMRPLAPFTETNSLLNFASLKTLHLACLWSFAGAGLFWGLHSIYRNLRKGPR